MNDYSRTIKHEDTTAVVSISAGTERICIHAYEAGKGLSAAIWLPMEMVEDLSHYLIGALMHVQDPPDPMQEV